MLSIQFNKEAFLRSAESFLKSEYGYGDWLVLHDEKFDDMDSPKQGNYKFYSYVVRQGYVDKFMSCCGWNNDTLSSGYDRYCISDGHVRQDHWIRCWDKEKCDSVVYVNLYNSSEIEISEEFSHFHGLKKNKKGNYEKLNKNFGDMEEVIKIEGAKVECKTELMKEYLASKKGGC